MHLKWLSEGANERVWEWGEDDWDVPSCIASIMSSRETFLIVGVEGERALARELGTAARQTDSLRPFGNHMIGGLLVPHPIHQFPFPTIKGSAANSAPTRQHPQFFPLLQKSAAEPAPQSPAKYAEGYLTSE
ncbi:hypothetical protein Ddc_06018 [Ditylenchus destructor]|nr:hypothetical protein Ddc_06018 [Ditylenchus destructor]